MKAQSLNVDRATPSVRADTDPEIKDASEIYLTPGGMLRLDVRRPGEVLVCLRGECWVTQEGDHADYLLTAGEAFPMQRRGMVLVQGLASVSRVRLGQGAAK